MASMLEATVVVEVEVEAAKLGQAEKHLTAAQEIQVVMEAKVSVRLALSGMVEAVVALAPTMALMPKPVLPESAVTAKPHPVLGTQVHTMVEEGVVVPQPQLSVEVPVEQVEVLQAGALVHQKQQVRRLQQILAVVEVAQVVVTPPMIELAVTADQAL